MNYDEYLKNGGSEAAKKRQREKEKEKEKELEQAMEAQIEEPKPDFKDVEVEFVKASDLIDKRNQELE